MRMISYKQHAELLQKLSKQISYLQYFLPWRMGMPVLANPGGKAGVYQTYRYSRYTERSARVDGNGVDYDHQGIISIRYGT